MNRDTGILTQDALIGYFRSWKEYFPVIPKPIDLGLKHHKELIYKDNQGNPLLHVRSNDIGSFPSRKLKYQSSVTGSLAGNLHQGVMAIMPDPIHKAIRGNMHVNIAYPDFFVDKIGFVCLEDSDRYSSLWKQNTYIPFTIKDPLAVMEEENIKASSYLYKYIPEEDKYGVDKISSVGSIIYFIMLRLSIDRPNHDSIIKMRNWIGHIYKIPKNGVMKYEKKN